MGSLRSLATQSYQEEQAKIQAEIERRKSIPYRLSEVLRVTYLDWGRKIQAIKLLREVSGVGLKEAKDSIEQKTWTKLLQEMSLEILQINMNERGITLKKLESDCGIKDVDC